MCGRTACSLDRSTLQKLCKAKFNNAKQYCPSYNICPGALLPVLVLQKALLHMRNNNTNKRINNEGNDRSLHCMKWGLIPSFSKNSTFHSKYNTINARCESLKKSPIYRRLLNTRRCIVPMQGYYEWQTPSPANKLRKKQKQPFFFSLEEGLMYFAALFDVRMNEEMEEMFSVTIITTAATENVQWCHSRMPLILRNEQQIRQWLDNETYSIQQCLHLQSTCVQMCANIIYHAIPREIIGNPKNKGKECIQTLQSYEARKRKQGIHKYFQPVKHSKSKKKTEIKQQQIKSLGMKKRKTDENVNDGSLKRKFNGDPLSIISQKPLLKKQKLSQTFPSTANTSHTQNNLPMDSTVADVNRII